MNSWIGIYEITYFAFVLDIYRTCRWVDYMRNVVLKNGLLNRFFKFIFSNSRIKKTFGFRLILFFCNDSRPLMRTFIISDSRWNFNWTIKVISFDYSNQNAFIRVFQRLYIYKRIVTYENHRSLFAPDCGGASVPEFTVVTADMK